MNRPINLLRELDAHPADPSAPREPSRRRRPGSCARREAERAESVRLMRVNHAGEVAAQALYQGQALMARDLRHARLLHAQAAAEEDRSSGLVRAAARRSLKARTSLLNPLWYVGSFAIGALAGVFGDRAEPGVHRRDRKTGRIAPARALRAPARRGSAQPRHPRADDSTTRCSTAQKPPRWG